MNREATIIESRKLFGDLSDHNGCQGMGNFHEIHWEWPEEIGTGFMSMIQLRPGLIMGIADYRLKEDIMVAFENDPAQIQNS